MSLDDFDVVKRLGKYIKSNHFSLGKLISFPKLYFILCGYSDAMSDLGCLITVTNY